MDSIIPEKIDVMSVGMTPFESYQHAVDVITRVIAAGGKAFIAAINPEKIYRAQYDLELREILSVVDLAICDGIGAKWAARTLAGKSVCRITGVSLFHELIKQAPQKKWRIFLLGASPEVNKTVRQKLRGDYPGLNIVGNLDGFFECSDDAVATINGADADILFVAFGSPKQEIWIRQNRERIDASICMGVGGTFDVVSGRVKRAPRLFRNAGLEWLYRLLREPSRIKRQLVLPKFVLLVLRQKLRFTSNVNPQGRKYG